MKLYDIIYADPPWRYDAGTTTDNRRIECHYPTMPLQEIIDMKIPAKKNAVLYLWATSPKLEEALAVMNAWGFSYRTSAVWDKINAGLGHWLLIQHEMLLIGRRGKFPCPPDALMKRSVIRVKKRRHSQKPDIVRTWIKEWYPEAECIELFARERWEGWDVHGNEAPTATQTILRLDT